MKTIHRFNRPLGLLLALFMALALTACGNSGGGASTGGSSGGSGGDKIPLTIWHIQTGGAADAIKGSVDRFMADNPQYNVTVVQKQNDSYKTDLSLAINAGTMPDVFITWGGQTLYDYVDEGLVYDLTSLMNADNYADEFLDAAIAQCTYKDKIYAVPVENISVAGFFYNKEVFDQYGLSEPATIADLESICDTLVANGVDPFALANATSGPVPCTSSTWPPATAVWSLSLTPPPAPVLSRMTHLFMPARPSRIGSIKDTSARASMAWTTTPVRPVCCSITATPLWI